VIGIDNSGPTLVVDTECAGTRKYLEQMVRGEIPNCLPQVSSRDLVDSGLLGGMLIFIVIVIAIKPTSTF